MSRCFPFPPPGYAKKARLEDVALLKKEKSREKKLRKEKKEKKDKEKRESKEKKHKDRSQEKQNEKNEKKVKNRDKRNDKDKVKDIQKASDKKRLLGESENHNGGSLAHKKHQVDDSILFEKTYSEQSGYAGAKLIQDNHLAEKAKRSEPMHDAGNRIKDEEGEKFSAMQSERDDKMVRLVAKGSATSMEKIKNHKFDDSKISISAMVQNSAATIRIGVEVVSKPPPLGKKDSKPSERKTEGRKEANEEIKEGKGNDQRKEKHGDKYSEKKVKRKDEDRENEKKREKKVKTKDEDRENEKKREKKLEKLDDRREEMNASKESNKEKSISSHSLRALLPANGDKSASPEGTSKKRKDFESNGFLHTDDIRPIKFQKLTSSGHPNPGNGKILGPCQTLVTSALERQGTANNCKLDSKERKINGVIEAHPSASSIKPTSTREVDQMAAPPPKPPHPDCRYFSQIYSLPKVEEWSDFCDQEWLSKSSNAQEKKRKSSKVEEMPLVWAEAFPIESADICALPYVIPY